MAVISVIAHILKHTHNSLISIEQIFRFMLLFVPVWWVWATHTLYSNRYDDDGSKHKIQTLLLMGLVIVFMNFTDKTLGGDFAGFALLYGVMRLILVWMYYGAHSINEQGRLYAKFMSKTIFIGACISVSAVLFDGTLAFVLFYLGISVEVCMMLRAKRLACSYPVHKKHLAERIGLFAIIVLGETVITIVDAFAAKTMDHFDILAMLAGFTLIAQIWWIFFGSLHRLERAKCIKSGYTMIFSHLFFYIGLLLLTNLVSLSISGELERNAFALLGVIGMSLFYIGKQIPYIHAFPPYRNGIIVNSVVCIGFTALASLMSRTEYALMMMSLGMMIYVVLNVAWLIPKFNVERYLEEQ